MTQEEVREKFNQFLGQYNNTFVEKEDDKNRNQCFDLAFAWMDALGIDRAAIRHELAYQIYENPVDLTVKYFDLIPNTPSAVTQVGDIVVWNSKYNGGAGHVGMAGINANTDTTEIFSQNDPLGTNSHLKIYNYAYIDGFLRLKTSAPAPVFTFTEQTLIPIGGTWGTQELQHFRSVLNDQANDIIGLEKDKENLNLAVAGLQERLNEAQAPHPIDISAVSTGDLFKELLGRLGLKQK